MSAAAPYGNIYQWGVARREAMCKMPRSTEHAMPQLQQNCNYARLNALAPGSVHRATPAQCRLQCTTTTTTSSVCFTLCKGSKLSRAKCLSPKSSRMSTSSMAASMSQYASFTDTTSFSKTSELYNTAYDNTPLPLQTQTNRAPLTTPRKPENDEVGVQELTVYEVNELDRWSPMLLSLSKLAVDWKNRFRLQLLGSLGDLVPFTNKIFDGSLKKRLGITAGIISVMRHYPKEDGLLFESVYSFYFGDYGHISVKGPYKSHEDTVLTVTGGSGIFTGVYGTVQIHNVEYPIVLFYRFQLYGIPRLPKALQWDTIPPRKGLRPSRTASLPGFALPNFTD